MPQYSLSSLLATLAVGCSPTVASIEQTKSYPSLDAVHVLPQKAALDAMVGFYLEVTDDSPLYDNVDAYITINANNYRLALYSDQGMNTSEELNSNTLNSDTATFTGSFFTELPATLFPAGQTSLATFIATDAEGNEATETTQSFSVCSLPELSLSPSFDTDTPIPNDGPFSIEAYAAAFCDITSVKIVGEELSETEMVEVGDGLYSVIFDPATFSFPEAATAEFFYSITARDDASPRQETTLEGSFTLEDVAAPHIESVTVSPDSVDNNPETQVTFTATITDIGSGIDPNTVCVQLNEEANCYPLASEGISYVTTALSGRLFSSPTTDYTLFAADFAGLLATYTGTLDVLNAAGLTFSDLQLSPSEVSNAEGSIIDIIAKAGDITDTYTIPVSCMLDGEDIGTLAYDGTSEIDEGSSETVYGFLGTYDTTALLAATNYLATEHVIECFVSDTDGNELSLSETLTFIDRLEPSLSCTVTDGANDGSATLDILCTAQDETAMNSVSYSSSSFGSDFLTNTTGDIFEASIDVTGLSAQLYNLTIAAEDAAGNTQEQTLSPTIGDALPPTIGSCSLSSSNISNTGGTITVTCTGVADETALDSLLFDAEFTSDEMTGSSGTYTGTLSVPSGTPANEYFVTITATDGVNTTSYTPLSLTVFDNTGPELSCLAIDGTNDGTTPLEIICEAADETAMNTVSYTSLLGSDFLTNTTGDIFESSIDGENIAGALYDFDITAEDAVGNTTPATVSAYILDILDPSVSCSFAASSISNASGSTTLTCTVSDETGIDSVAYSSSLGSGAMTASGTDTYTATISASPTTAADTYSIMSIGTDTSGNTKDAAVSLVVTDDTVPIITSVYATPDTVADDGSEAFVISVCVNDETDGTELDRTDAVQVTIDSILESLSYNSSTACYDSRAINGDELTEGIYTLTAEALDAAGNSTIDSSATVSVTCSAASLSNITFSDSEVYNDSNHGDVVLSVDVAAGTCSASIEAVTAELYNSSFNPSTRSDGHSIFLTMTDSNSDETYESNTMTPYEDLYLGEYSAEVTITNTDGVSTTASGSAPLTVSSICDMLGSEKILEAFVNGTSAASLNTSVDTNELSSFDIIRLGYSGTAFQQARVNYNGETVEDMDLSSCSGGSFSSGSYVTSSWHDCAMADSYDGTVASWSVAIINVGGGTMPALNVNSASTSGTGPNWFYNTGTGTYQLDDGVTGSRANFAVGGSYFTICGKP